jgi:hypothetical protein
MRLSRRAKTPNFGNLTRRCKGAKRSGQILKVSRTGIVAAADWYHRRSRVGTKMHCLKLLGQRLSARDFDRQVAEIQIRAAILNTALGIPRTEPVG